MTKPALLFQLLCVQLSLTLSALGAPGGLLGLDMIVNGVAEMLAPAKNFAVVNHPADIMPMPPPQQDSIEPLPDNQQQQQPEVDVSPVADVHIQDDTERSQAPESDGMEMFEELAPESQIPSTVPNALSSTPPPHAPATSPGPRKVIQVVTQVVDAHGEDIDEDQGAVRADFSASGKSAKSGAMQGASRTVVVNEGNGIVTMLHTSTVVLGQQQEEQRMAMVAPNVFHPQSAAAALLITPFGFVLSVVAILL